MRILFATAEFSPVAAVGGLASAAAGLVDAVRRAGAEVVVVLPDYGEWELRDEQVVDVDVPSWVGHAAARRGVLDGVGEVVLVDVPGIARSHPYLSPTGEGWEDNDRRFFAFSAVTASLAGVLDIDVLHLNDWHTATTLAHLPSPIPTVYTIHNLAYQGHADRGWLDVFDRREAFDRNGSCNPAAGAIRLADRVVAVSPTYVDEIRTPAYGFGLDDLLRSRGDAVVGILNGIDTSVWDPSRDDLIAATYSMDDRLGKDRCRDAIRHETGLESTNDVVVGMVTRLTDQKGVDIALDCIPYLADMGVQLVVVGAGDAGLAHRLSAASTAHPERIAFHEGYDEELSHRVFAGSDLLLMPSRFEPCGLAQMQAMRYGTIPVVTDVGGLHDTVVDADRSRVTGTGFIASAPHHLAVLDALHRAVRASRHRRRRDAIRRRGMAIDWSWSDPAARYVEMYRELVAG